MPKGFMLISASLIGGIGAEVRLEDGILGSDPVWSSPGEPLGCG